MNALRVRSNPVALLLMAGGMLVLAACSEAPEAVPAGAEPLVLGLLPDESAEQQRRKYAPLVEAIRTRTGLETRLSFADSYADLVDQFAAGRVHVAYFGGYTFLAAERRAGAIPLVMRDIDARFTSYVVVPEQSTARVLTDLEGARFAFGSRLSTSGHVMPRYFFKELGIEPERWFSAVSYSGAHDRTLEWVRDGKAEAGVVNAQLLRGWLAREGARAGLRVVWQSPPYVDYVWAVRPDLSGATRAALAETFLAMSTDNPASREFLEAIGSRHFLPAHRDDFTLLRAALEIVADATPGIH